VAKKDKVVYAKLIANPGAGKAGDLSKSIKLAVKCLEQLGVQVDVALAKPKEEATRIASKAVKEGYKTVIAMGGDGTLEAVMHGLVGTKTRMGILPFGTENNVAKSLGIPENLEEACALIAKNESRKVDIGQIKLKGGEKTYFFELAVIGLAAALYPPANKILKGQLNKIKEAAETIMQHDSNSKVYMKLDEDSRISAETMLVVVSNTPMFGKNFLVAPHASLDDGLLDVSVYPNFSKAELLAYYATVMNEGYSENEKVQHYRVRKFGLKTKPPLAVNADAISLGTGDVKIRCLGGALRVLAPQPDGTPNAIVSEAPVAEMPAPLSPPVTTNEKEAVEAVGGEKEK
jgi:diacylglycerol kinase (ATP)